jgi:O-antigen/teichoic acid export membrane protein
MALGRPGVVASFQATGVVVSILGMFLLVPKLGIVGVALSLLTGSLVRLVLTVSCFRPLLKVSAPSAIINEGDLVFLRSRLTSFLSVADPIPG